VSKRRDAAPIWARPAPGSRRPRFSREAIAEAAIAIADAEGIDAVSMRRVAEELGAGTMTLYHYVRTKDDLIALMDDALMAEALIPDDELPRGWRAALTAIARSSRATYMRHPWALYALRGARLGPNGMHHIEQSLQAVEDTGLTDGEKVSLLGFVDDYVFGHVLRAAEAEAEADTISAMKTRTMIGFVTDQLATGRYPRLQATLGDGDMRQAWERLSTLFTAEEQFERGLAAILDGAARGMPSRTHVRATPPTHRHRRLRGRRHRR
jgi:AcrR family transcriptional regulator